MRVARGARFAGFGDGDQRSGEGVAGLIVCTGQVS